jgi:hypothetical protein
MIKLDRSRKTSHSGTAQLSARVCASAEKSLAPRSSAQTARLNDIKSGDVYRNSAAQYRSDAWIEKPHLRLLNPHLYPLATSVPLKSLKGGHFPLACVQIAATWASC